MNTRQELNGVMYALYHVRNLDDVRANRYMYNIYKTFIEDFDPETKQNFIEAIEWALQQENIGSCCSLPHLPHDDSFKRQYLEIVLSHLKNAIQ
ncbi:MAG: hypothetical protein OEZ39_18765 [Gammaproteobacteria bacterium]|nr:hypothetical protein [Gammaproteobacteria bacterium]MDH5653907.1 hypothetical protein [Gammaproteobacteria bacterium]